MAFNFSLLILETAGKDCGDTPQKSSLSASNDASCCQQPSENGKTFAKTANRRFTGCAATGASMQAESISAPLKRLAGNMPLSGLTQAAGLAGGYDCPYKISLDIPRFADYNFINLLY